MANSVDPDQTAAIEAVCCGSTPFASILDLSVILGNYLQQTTSSDDIFGCIFFLGALSVSFIKLTAVHSKAVVLLFNCCPHCFVCFLCFVLVFFFLQYIVSFLVLQSSPWGRELITLILPFNVM